MFRVGHEIPQIVVDRINCDLEGMLWSRCWASGFFVKSSGNVADEVIREYIKTQDIPKPDDFKVSDNI